jgi:signal transduction histidine kinase
MSRSLWLLVALLCATTALGWLDYITGPQLSFGLFYVVPVSLAGWLLGQRGAWLVTAAVCMAQFTADFSWAGQDLSPITLWNLFTRVLVLGALGHLVAWIRRDRDRLDQLLSQRISAHVETVDQLRHRDRLALVGQIASGLAHELGTPLNVIAGRAKLLLDPSLAKAELSAHSRSIIEQTERMTRLIRQLLDFARRRGPELGPVDIRSLCRHLLELLEPLARKRNVGLHLDSSDGDCTASVDYNQIQQAVSNLVMNALQAMPTGGQVVVRVQSEQAEQIAISVTDTGTGIAKEHLQRIFEPFFTTQAAGDGTGLGLSITEGIVRDHDGSIQVESELGRGTTFRITLPRNASRRSPSGVRA